MLPRGPRDWSLDVLPRGPMELDLDVLPRGPLKLNLDVLPRGPLKLNFGRASQRSDGLEFIIHTDVCGPFTLIPAK